MSWKNDLDNAKKVFQNGTTKEKLDYIVEYYKLHIFIIVFVLYFIGSMIYTNVTAKDCILQGLFLNTLSDSEAALELKDDFIREFSIDTDSEDVFFDSSLYYLTDAEAGTSTTAYETLQVITAKSASGDIDFMVADDPVLIEFAYDGYLYELSEVLSDEQIKKYEPYFLYYDKAVLEELSNIDYTAEEIPEIILPDPSKPELMEAPVPVMINVTESERLSILYPNSTQKYAIAFVVNGVNTEKIIDFLEYLIQ